MGNIFIGLGEFHLEKVLLDVVEQFLEKIGVHDIFVQNEIYTRAITGNKVMTVGDYILSRQGMQILFEVISRLRFSLFLNEKLLDKSYGETSDYITTEFQGSIDRKIIREQWSLLVQKADRDKLITDFALFNQ